MHLYPGWLGKLLLFVILALIAVLFFIFYPKLSRYLRKKQPAPAPSYSEKPGPSMRMKKAVENIRSRGHKNGDYRNALFSLSSYSRTYYSKKCGIDLTTRTAKQMMEGFSSKEPADFFDKLGRVLFKDAEIAPERFDQLCDRAIKTGDCRFKKR